MQTLSTGIHRCVAFSPNGAHVASESFKFRSTGIWDVSTGLEIPSPNNVGGRLGTDAICYLPNGAAVLYAVDKTLRLWDATILNSSISHPRRWEMKHDRSGWLVSPTDPSNYMMLVPHPHELPEEGDTLVMPRWRVPHIDLSTAKLGEDWAQCYQPTS
jgi:WD40 repeat protein